MPELIPIGTGRVVQILDSGPSASAAVFLLPGCPDSRLVGHGVAVPGVRLISVNRPGYGSSTVTASGHLTVADDVVAVADELGIGRFAVLGMSVGGGYALACAVRHPSRVSAVGLVGAPAPPGPGSPTMRTAEEMAAMPSDFARFAASILAPTDVGPSGADSGTADTAGAASAGSDADDLAVAARWLAVEPALTGTPAKVLGAAAREALSRPEGYLRDAWATFRTWDFDPADVRCPVDIWCGTRDTAAGRWYAEHLPTAQVVFDPATTHLDTLLTRWPEILTALTS